MGHGAATREPSGEIRNPYKGLRAFLEADAGDFFGREAVTKRLLRSLAEDDPAARFLAVVGPSGSGKSSVVRAGLVPALRRGAIPGSERWYVIEVLPGRHPLREIEAALLGVAVEPPPSLMEVLEQDELGLVRSVDRVLPEPGAELVIVVDQLEEVFTLVDDEHERSHLLASLRAAAFEPESHVRVVTTLRADFYDVPLSVPGFGDLLAARTEAITPMRPEELERAIVAPADRAGLVVEPRLLAEMIAEVADRPGALPLLQYALTELAEGAKDGVLSLDAYRRIGRVSGALARRAEQLFEPLNETAQDACQQLFLRLVTLGEGAEDTRRRVRRSELLTLADARAMDGVIETYGRHRLLSFDRDPDTREPTVEIAHEALLREWARLRAWIDEARDDLRQRARISFAMSEWVQADRSFDYLMTGIRLAQAEEATARDTIRPTETEREYLDASLARRDAEVAAEHKRHAREIQLERRAQTRLRGLVAVLAAGLLVAASLTAVAVNRSREADRRTVESIVGGLTSTSIASLGSDPELSLVLALNAIDAVPSGEPVPAATVEALHWAIQESGIQYPVVDGPVAVVPGPGGYRGVFDLPVSDLANLALPYIDRDATARACERFFAEASACSGLPDRFAQGIPSVPLNATSTDRSLARTSVSFGGVADEGLARELEQLSEATGIDIQVSGPNFDQLVNDPPDIEFVAQPGWVASQASEGRLMNLGTYLDMDQLASDYSPYLLSLGTVAPDGSWPAEQGNLYGLPVNLSLKSLIWYPVPEFRRAGYAIPETWNELVALTDRMVADGRTPWCMGLESGTADGWPATDWVENLLLGEAGPSIYDRWTFHEMPFDHRAVRRAFERFGQIAFGDRNLAVGTHGAVVSEWGLAQLPMVESDPPQCWLYHFPSFASLTLPPGSVGRTTDAFPFPSLNPTNGDAVLGGMQTALVLADRPEVREVVRFLAAPGFGQDWFAAGDGSFSANNRFDASAYAPPWRRQAQELRAALAADTFRLDGGDLMPPKVGTGPFWNAMLRYLEKGPGSLDGILADLEAAWPDDG